MGYKGTNFSLKDEEAALLTDVTFFEKKQLLAKKIVEFLGDLEADYFELTRSYYDILPPGIQNKRGKISRGENYRGLPYFILDAPAIFEKNSVLAYRSLVWWGHPFTATFHLSGRFLESYMDRLVPKLQHLDQSAMICINKNSWEHHLQRDNYIPVTEFLESNNNSLEFFREQGFLKVTIPVDMHKSEQWKSRGIEFLENILTLLK